ncbi:hypothetical protein, partial [Salmonella sp. s55884]|uniref:hypothetical protein n=1 Tax=Salmonella sp. s55884 TaxID=3159683 RepID=UPI00397F0A49
LVLPVQQEHRELQATVDAQDVQDAVGTKASMDSLVHEEEREIKVVAVKMVPMVLVEPLAPKVLPELVVELVREVDRVQLEHKVIMVQMVLQVVLDPRDLLDQLDDKEVWAHLEP